MWWKTWYSGLNGFLLPAPDRSAKFVRDYFSQQKSWGVKAEVKSHSISFPNGVQDKSVTFLHGDLSFPAQVFYSCVLYLEIRELNLRTVKWTSLSHIACRVLQFCKSLGVSKCFHHIQECPGHLAGLELVYTNELPFALQLPPTI